MFCAAKKAHVSPDNESGEMNASAELPLLSIDRSPWIKKPALLVRVRRWKTNFPRLLDVV